MRASPYDQDPGVGQTSRGEIMRADWGSVAFLVIMLSASALTMVRMAAVAGLLAPVDFARYATIIATGAYLATVISFGAVEATIKAFPRLVEDSRQGELRGRAYPIFALLARRAALVGVPSLVIGHAFGLDWLRDFGLAAGYAFGTASMALVASLQRALNNAPRLAAGTFMRTFVVFFFVVGAAWAAGLDAALAAEVGATALVCALSVQLFVPRSEHRDAARTPALPVASGDRSGRTVFLANSAVNAPFYLDRLYVSVVMGGEVAGRYAVLALFLMFAALLVGIIAQRVGPDAIRLVHRDQNAVAATRHMARWIALSSAFWLIFIVGAAFALAWPSLPESISRYGIEPHLVAPIAVSGILLNLGLLEFLVIALDREAALLRAALGFLVMTLIAASAVALFGAGLVEMLWALAGCRMLYGFMLVLALRSGRPGNMSGLQPDAAGSDLARMDMESRTT